MATKKKKVEDVDINIDTINNMSPLTIGSYGGDAVKNIHWIAAIDSWDYCDPTPLSEMINNHDIPLELKPIISKIVSGERKQEKIGASKLKLPAKSRLAIASLILELRHIPEAALSGLLIPNYTEIASRQGIEVCDIQKKYRGHLKEFDSDIMSITGLSKKSIQNLINQLKKKLDDYPNI